MLFFSALALAGEPMALDVTSTAFTAGSTIPTAYTCSGQNTSPALTWSAGPSGTVGYALVVDDPDAPVGTWVHWTVWNIPASTTSLPGGVTASSSAFVQGVTDFGTSGYGGPCPPKGNGAHRYFFRVYALDRQLSLTSTATRKELDNAMAGHVLAQGELMGKFWRDP